MAGGTRGRLAVGVGFLSADFHRRWPSLAPPSAVPAAAPRAHAAPARPHGSMFFYQWRGAMSSRSIACQVVTSQNFPLAENSQLLAENNGPARRWHSATAAFQPACGETGLHHSALMQAHISWPMGGVRRREVGAAKSRQNPDAQVPKRSKIEAPKKPALSPHGNRRVAWVVFHRIFGPFFRSPPESAAGMRSAAHKWVRGRS